MTNPLPQATDEQIREALDALDHHDIAATLAAPKRPLGRVARIFHRRGMWSLSADMLAPSEEPQDAPRGMRQDIVTADDDDSKTPAQAKASDDSASPQP